MADSPRSARCRSPTRSSGTWTNPLEAGWEDIAIVEFAAGDRADEISDRYLVFTIIFASVLFFGGISGKFRWQIVDVVVLSLGALALFIGLTAMFSLPYT